MEENNFRISVVVIIAIFALSAMYFMSPKINNNPPQIQTPNSETPIYSSSGEIENVEIKKFTSEDEFKTYLEISKANSNSGFYGGNSRAFTDGIMETDMAPSMKLNSLADSGQSAQRTSETNVQVAGIDEPDIVKTNGKEIYLSSFQYYYEIMDSREESMPYYNIPKTKIINAFPPADLKLDGEIIENGNLLLDNNILMIFTRGKIYAYDVSDKTSPQKKWTLDLNENNNRVITSRLHKNKIYLITAKYINYSQPCPIKTFSIDGKALKIDCNNIYHPTVPIEADSTYTISIIDPKTGKVEKNTSFIGSNNNSVIYMSENAIYATYYYTGDFLSFMADFFSEKCSDLIPSNIIKKLKKLNSYDISQQSKYVEFETILEKLDRSLSSDEKLQFENEIENRATEYFSDHSRELEKTGIFKISTDNLDILANGNIPGALLNQFSLDEFEGNLRVASTIGEASRFFFGNQESVNDIYVLNNNLEKTGEVLDLGKTEKIYSVRFLEDKGYVVTFRQTDPFYVLDLSDANDPQLKGELKIPGYSSYLHPIAENKILGIGKENSKVKISLFDVSSAENPKEVSKYTLDEYWSGVLSTHHAFLQDAKHNIFFLPGNKGGYIFSYKNDQLKLVKAISGISAQRALYLNDYLYIIGNNKITILNEIDWEKVNELEF